MSKAVKIALITLISLCIIALVAYGYMSTREIEKDQDTRIQSNISQHLNLKEVDEKALEDDPEEDLDGDEAVVEDDDFETYVEPEEEDWDEPATVPTTIPESTTTKSDTSPAQDSTFLVITGSFGSGSNARKNVRKFKKKGFPAEIIKSKKNQLNSICVGRFDDPSKAEALVRELRTKHDQKSFVRRTVLGKEDE